MLGYTCKLSLAVAYGVAVVVGGESNQVSASRVLSTHEDKHLSLFNSWKVKHAKTYKDDEEHTHRYVKVMLMLTLL